MEQISSGHSNVDQKLDHQPFVFAPQDANVMLSYLLFSFLALFLGTIAGLLQGLQRANFIQLPPDLYYLLLTVHGVFLALVFTIFFIFGYLYSGVTRTLGGVMKKKNRLWAWWGFYIMAAGSLLAAIPVANNNASVLYTFYAPMHASPWFYFGVGLLIVGSWVSSVPILAGYFQWRRENPGKTTPLFAYMSVATLVLWLISSGGVVFEVFFQFIPWAFGWVEGINVSLTRTLFWYFGHPLVYFWLLPAYIYWYVNIPKIIGGKLFSDSLPRLTFILFILYSIPVGFHHQLMEPGISSFWKFVQVILTMIVVVPSLMTVFSLLATFELTGREKGATGRFGWLKKLPWGDVRFFAPFVAMVLFIPAGAGGIINASYQLNQVVHNTLWVPGHFHMTLATSVVLTFFAISYWLVPILTKRKLTPLVNRLGIIQSLLWGVGVLLMGGTMHIVGLFGSPRRSSYSTYGEHSVVSEWAPYLQVVGVGSVLLYLGTVLYLATIVYLLFFAPKTDTPVEYPIGVPREGAEKPPAILERWSVWVGITIALILIAYAYPVYQMIQHAPPGSVPIRSW